MSAPAPRDVVVIGAGVIGLSIAWRAGAAGLDVTVVDPVPGRGASWAAAGMLAPVGEAHFGEDALTALNLEAARLWPDFARDLETASGRPVHLRCDGTLLVAGDVSDRAATDDVLRYRQSLGLEARRLTARQCREAEPLLTPGVSGGAELAGDHQVDNRRVVEALEGACGLSGASFVDDEVTDVLTEGGRVTGVVLARGGSVSAGAVVVAAGCRSGQLGGVPDSVLPPVRPVKGLTLRLGVPDDAPRLRRTVRGLVRGRNCYLVPRPDGTVVVGASVEEAGFDMTVPVRVVAELLDDARRLVPAVDEYAIVDTTVGLRPGSPDNAPIVGSTDIDGLLVATGHYRNGILLAPLTAREITRLLVDRQSGSGSIPAVAGAGHVGPARPFDRFGPRRFAPVGPPRRGSAVAGPQPAAHR
jgi:glycine oxidase